MENLNRKKSNKYCDNDCDDTMSGFTSDTQPTGHLEPMLCHKWKRILAPTEFNLEAPYAWSKH